MSESKKKLFSIYSPEAIERRIVIMKVLDRINSGSWDDPVEKENYLRSVLGSLGEHCRLFEPISFTNGTNLFIDHDVFINSNVTFIDVAPIHIGAYTMIAPGTVITTVGHPLSAKERRGYMSYAEPITIGHDVWIGANCTIFPGITIGNNVIIGANSVVNKDIPADWIAAGAPARLIRVQKN